MSDDARPIGDVLDGIGIKATIADGELVAGALVLLKVIDTEGDTRLSLACSDGLGWIERAGMLRIAEAMETGTSTLASDDSP
ncbi:MAG: hypothetical protein HOV92_37075 [Streptomyces sp.]|nr:hypothetical protein [Streptomyces sp.]